MDTEDVSYAEFSQCLRHLNIINHCTLAYRPTLRWIAKVGGWSLNNRTLEILDVGCGGGDMMREIWRFASARKLEVSVTGVDLNPHAVRFGERHTPETAPLSYITHDLFTLELPRKPDVIISSLFAHHLTCEQLIRFIQWMDDNAAYGWFINDLHRHPVPFYFIKAITKLLPFNRFVKHDAAVSVARAFTRRDWREMLSAAGIPEQRSVIAWHFPFRFCLSCSTK